MLFSLKNTGATYQRAMTHIFDNLIHNQVECYIDDLVVKSKVKEAHLYDLRIVFERLHCYDLKINPLKYAIDVTSGKFLGFVVRHRGIEIDPAKIEAILDMPFPKILTQLRSLQDRLAYIRRFISNLFRRCQPFSVLVKKDIKFMWDEKC
ncbi:putative mitochondrial protein [Dendrobium catenatum]|uniref:Putative mitochondrial protein n=1 Tax=Dendrobium catenatum TaxID=906689 RepID=A0A2I0WZD5_9ASPA|nr:putative mitochondrial protein [Dendrobium catenatum]